MLRAQLFPNLADGTVNMSQIEKTVRQHYVHFTRTDLIAFEDTRINWVLPAGYVVEVGGRLTKSMGMTRAMDMTYRRRVRNKVGGAGRWSRLNYCSLL